MSSETLGEEFLQDMHFGEDCEAMDCWCHLMILIDVIKYHHIAVGGVYAKDACLLLTVVASILALSSIAV